MYEVRNDLGGSYVLTDDIDASPTNPANVEEWDSGTGYEAGAWVKHNFTGTMKTFYCILGNINIEPGGDPHWEDYWELMWVTAEGWLPIGTWLDQFTGTLDGGANEISGLFIDRSDTNNVGLFGVLGADGIVKNVEFG